MDDNVCVTAKLYIYILRLSHYRYICSHFTFPSPHPQTRRKRVGIMRELCWNHAVRSGLNMHLVVLAEELAVACPTAHSLDTWKWKRRWRTEFDCSIWKQRRNRALRDPAYMIRQAFYSTSTLRVYFSCQDHRPCGLELLELWKKTIQL